MKLAPVSSSGETANAGATRELVKRVLAF